MNIDEFILYVTTELPWINFMLLVAIILLGCIITYLVVKLRSIEHMLGNIEWRVEDINDRTKRLY